jgi:catechol 1,2-dioxygenase
VTPARGEGPYYRPDAPFRSDLNVLGREGTAIRIRGHVRSAEGCVPLAGALVDVWHAMQGPPDPPYDMASADYEFRGRMLTDEHGRYEIRTLRPPNYPDSVDGHMVQAHLHLRVSADGHTSIITQIVFSDDPYNGDHTPTVEVTLVDDGSGVLTAEHELVLDLAV